MNAMRMLTSKWTLGLGAAILIAAAANVSLAAGPGRDGYRGGWDNGRPAQAHRDRDYGRQRVMDRDRGGDHGRFDGPDRRGGFEPARRPRFAPPAVRLPLVCGGVPTAGMRVIGGMGGFGITIIIR